MRINNRVVPARETTLAIKASAVLLSSRWMVFIWRQFLGNDGPTQRMILNRVKPVEIVEQDGASETSR